MNRSKQILLRIVFLAVSLTMLCGCNKKSHIKSIADLSGKRIAVQAATTSEELVAENEFIHDPQILTYASYYDAVGDLLHGDIDAIVVDYMPATKLLAKYSDLTTVPDSFPPEEYAIAVKKGNTELLKMINEGIDLIRNTGEYSDLIDAFMPANGEIILPDGRERYFAPKTLTIGTNAAFPPFEYIYKDEIVGFDICIIQMIALRNNLKPVIKNMDFAKLFGALQNDTVDCVIAGMSVTEERAELVDFSKPYFSSHQVIIVKK